jgi:DNA-binding transcriptional MerR regulator/methylmalonyl-CoA mutase cobalamin-binding subunit
MADADAEGKIETVPADEQLLPMGAVRRRTGIGEHTLRAWERRFGFPTPVRLPSGHRRYTADQVRRLLLVAEALRRGFRAGDVVPAAPERLEELLREAGHTEQAIRQPGPGWLEEVKNAGRELDRPRLQAMLHRAAATLGIGGFLRERVQPLLIEVGMAWARGELEIRHEHFISEVVEGVLRELRAPLEPGASGRPVVLASLPGERHGLGLQVAALAIAAAGRPVVLLGPELPVADIVQAAATVDAAAVGLSITASTAAEGTLDELSDLRRQLPARTRLWLGGSGVGLLEELPAHAEPVPSLDDLDRALRRLAG